MKTKNGDVAMRDATVRKPAIRHASGNGNGHSARHAVIDEPLIHRSGVDGKIADVFNDVLELSQRMADELQRLRLVVGKEGKISQRASIGEVTGSWAKKVEAVNALISDLVHPISETSRVIGAVAKGDLSQSMALEVEGRPLAGEFLRRPRRSTRWWTSSAASPRK
jgi:hypothetical protein